MARLRFKDLVFDVTADESLAPSMARFWSTLLGQPLSAHDDGDFHLEAPEPMPPSRHVWIDQVPERAVDPSRVHLAVQGGPSASDQLLVMGAELLGMADSADRLFRAPDGLIVRLEATASDDGGGSAGGVGSAGGGQSQPALTPVAIYVESSDPSSIAGWWQSLLDGEVQSNSDQAVLVGGQGFPYARFVFTQNAGPKLVKNRMHWDVLLDSIDVAGLIEHGATLLREPDENARWWVLQDPDGNEFCAFNPS